MLCDSIRSVSIVESFEQGNFILLWGGDSGSLFQQIECLFHPVFVHEGLLAGSIEHIIQGPQPLDLGLHLGRISHADQGFEIRKGNGLTTEQFRGVASKGKLPSRILPRNPQLPSPLIVLYWGKVSGRFCTKSERESSRYSTANTHLGLACVDGIRFRVLLSQAATGNPSANEVALSVCQHLQTTFQGLYNLLIRNIGLGKSLHFRKVLFCCHLGHDGR